MKKLWTDNGWDDYVYWQTQDKKALKKINELIQDIERNGNDGIGHPEALHGDLAGWWSRRIDGKNRIVHRLVPGSANESDTDNAVEIAQCRGHYSDN